MTLPWSAYASLSQAVRYDGTNAAAIIAYLQTQNVAAIVVPPNTVAVDMFGGVAPSGSIACSGGDVDVIPIDGYLVRSQDAGPLRHWSVWASPLNPKRMYQIVRCFGDADIVALGIATVPTLIGGAAVNIDVTIRPTYSDSNYQATAALSGTVSLLAALSVTSVTVLSSNVVRVRVQNTGLLSLSGAQVVVSAIHN